MQYDLILIDMFNLYYRRKSSALEKDPISMARNIISFIENDVEQHLVENGNLYLLYDPIPKTDLGYSKIFKYTERQNIVRSYKNNRTHDRNVLTVVDFVRKYFLHRGQHIITVISNSFEADDYVESILKENIGKKALMITNDEDWCKFLSDDVEMMNWDWDKMMTFESFNKKYNFYPSIAGVCVWKACFGDGADTSDNKIKMSAGSDNITGALQVKGLKKANDIKLSAFEYIKWLGTHTTSVEDVEKYKVASYIELLKKENKDPQDEFFCKINSLDPKYEIQSTFFSNLSVIKTRCKSYKKYATAKDIDDKFNSLIENVLGIGQTENKKFRFGNIKG